ncbi:30S ribosome-binding factor RbfA [Methylacidimicrobium tartarophylax]|uniref:Ribosome-binding factor A n=1 Tax=Methylacidimicrobium tartarophylax TaxID=1041768 RepID=A0A5E6M8Z8_9BACT|nr:30S ribosome-binding factor RbfA [Methylacidimicrobium tartarophylax]VVM05677.1 Ribosome-binding factor A [Methylacidimicrobium tartarophylax]
MGTHRAIRVSQVIRKELAQFFQREVLLEGLLLTISAVETTPDLKEAFVFISAWESPIPRDKLLSLLHRHRREWQHRLGKKLQSKFTPQLTFRFDDSLERGDRILRILQEIETQQVPHQNPPAESG